MSKIERNQLIELFKIAIFTDSYTKGQITVDSSSLAQSLQIAFDNTEDTGWQSLTTNSVEVNQTCNFYYKGVLTSKFGHVFKNVDQLCQNNHFRAKRGKQYYIIELSFDSNDSEKPPIIQNYEKLLNLIETLKKVSAFCDTSTSTMFFLDSDKLEIEPIYSTKELETLDIDYLNKINVFIDENAHESQKLTILGKAIINLCKNEPLDNRFTFLLSKLKDIYETLDHDYAVFASSFSYEKLRNDIENAKLEEQVKIHKVITDIQNQILGIPIATVIVATQFKTQKGAEFNYMYQFAVNSGITMGVIIFSIIMWYLVKNQKESLVSLNIEIERKNEKFKVDSRVVYDKVVASTGEEPFKKIFDRIKRQEAVLCAIHYISIAACIITFLIYLNITVNPWS
jgi:hypothetical protein